eukprot:TRINITY_DN11151_c0_g1_i8.p1 TRINITY_DN11151_c0_g1~~TRINITY_DN11151_c0_g1_i8.p1  ORF type:complete len:247 (-),score=34.19 TRINITY_DN11151_c0_g1_i8:1790-2530(-)
MQELLTISPSELKFQFELSKQISSSLCLYNQTSEYVAFKVKTTSPKKYCVRPNTGVVQPHGSIEVTVTMQSQKEAPPDMICKDKFLIQSVIVEELMSHEKISPELFQREPGRDVREAKLRVMYVQPPQPPSPVAESAEEGLSPKTPVKDGVDRSSLTSIGNDFRGSVKDSAYLQAKLQEMKTTLLSLTEERNDARSQKQRVEEELVKLKNRAGANCGPSPTGRAGFSFLTLLVVAIVAFLIGLFMK